MLFFAFASYKGENLNGTPSNLLQNLTIATEVSSLLRTNIKAKLKAGSFIGSPPFRQSIEELP